MDLPPPFVTKIADQIAESMKLRPEQVPTVSWFLFLAGGALLIVVARYTWRRILRRIRILLGLPIPEETVSMGGGGGAFTWMVAIALGVLAYLLLGIIL